MNVFYNLEGVGDTLLIMLKDISLENRDVKKKGDVVRISDKQTGETAGFNIFQASTYYPLTGKGAVEITEETIKQINQILQKNDFLETIEVDLSPKFVVGKVLTKEKHPNADKLNICQVDIGSETLQIVCGAANVEQGQKVVVAKVGAVMPSGLVIKDAELRGVASSGMICSAKELDLPDAPQEKGILVLNEDRETGTPFLG